MTTDLILGVDISTLEDTEKQGGKFYDNGNEASLIEILKNNGVSSVRLRVWNDPYSADGGEYGGGTCDTDKMIRIARRVKAAGMSFMLDLHYSDFWCDPARQCTPKAWVGMDTDEMCEALYEFTKTTLKRFSDAGVSPEYVQVGNEITNGMLWPLAKLDREKPESFSEQFDKLAKLIASGTRAVRELSAETKIIIHLEQSGKNDLWREWFDNAKARGMDYDIIGASYYPIWHGDFKALEANMNDMTERYGKDVMIVETAYAFTSKHFDPESKRLMIDDDVKLPDGSPPPFPYTKEGQADYMRSLFETAARIKDGRCKGVYYWEPGWLPLEESTWATRSALKDIGEEEKGTGNEWANQCLFDYSGNANPAIYEFRRFNESGKSN